MSQDMRVRVFRKDCRLTTPHAMEGESMILNLEGVTLSFNSRGITLVPKSISLAGYSLLEDMPSEMYPASFSDTYVDGTKAQLIKGCTVMFEGTPNDVVLQDVDICLGPSVFSEDKEWFTQQEAAVYVGCDVKTIRSWEHLNDEKGEPMLPNTKRAGAGNVRYARIDLDIWRRD